MIKACAVVALMLVTTVACDGKKSDDVKPAAEVTILDAPLVISDPPITTTTIVATTAELPAEEETTTTTVPSTLVETD